MKTRSSAKLVGGMVVLLLLGCASAKVGDSADPSPGESAGPEPAVEDLVDFYGQLTVDVASEIVGTWTLKGYSLGLDPSDEEDGQYVEYPVLTVTFHPDGTITPPTAPPLMDFGTISTYEPRCEGEVLPEGIVGSTVADYGWSPRDGKYFYGAVNPRLTYQVIETLFNPLVRLTAANGGSFTSCCPGSFDDSSALVFKSQVEEGEEEGVSQEEEDYCVTESELYQSPLEPLEWVTGQLVVVGAKEGALALLGPEGQYLAILERVP